MMSSKRQWQKRGCSVRLLTYPELKALKGIPYTTQHLLRLEKAGKLPKRVKLGDGRFGRVAWVESEIDRYIRSRMAARGEG